MKIENTVEVDAPLDRVWALVNDIPRVAPCMPGAALTGVLDDTTYEGTVAVKLGPLRMSYKGKVTIDEVDEANHSARLTASGKDTKGAGTARASVETHLEPAGDTHTRLRVTSDVQLTGKVASFGRGGAINDVATRLFGQFADCLRATLEAESATAPGLAAAEAGTGAGAAPGSGPAAAAVAEAGAPGSAVAGAPGGPGASPPAAGASPPAAGASPSGAGTVPPSEPGAAGDGSTTAGDGGATAPAAPPAATVTPGTAPVSPAPPPRAAAEALDAGSLVGTVIKGRLAALFQAIAGFFRRLFGGRRSTG
jgi:carbon monoxide dehydrogenase subunit G